MATTLREDRRSYVQKDKKRKKKTHGGVQQEAQSGQHQLSGRMQQVGRETYAYVGPPTDGTAESGHDKDKGWKAFVASYDTEGAR